MGRFGNSLVMVALLGLVSFGGQTAFGAFIFDDAIDINLSVLSIGLSDEQDVLWMDFGAGGQGRGAINGVDEDSDGVVSQDDTQRLVGHTLVSQYTKSDYSTVVNLDTFDLVAVLRDWDGTVTSVTSTEAVTEYDAGSLAGGTGLLELWLDWDGSSGPSTPFDVADASDSVDGIKLGTFEILGGTTETTLEPHTSLIYTSDTEGVLMLVEEHTAGLFTTTDGTSLLGPELFLATFVDSSEQPIWGPTLTGIDGTGDNPDIDDDGMAGAQSTESFSPPTTYDAGKTAFNSGGLFDVYVKIDGNTSFAVIPEPASMLIWGVLFVGLVGFVRVRCRRVKS